MTTQADVEPQPETVDGSSEETLTTEAPTLESLQAALAEKETQIAKLQNDLKAWDEQRRKQSGLDAKLAEISDEQKAQRRVFNAYAKAVTGGETDTLQTDLSVIERESSQARGSRQFQARYDNTVAKLSEVITGENQELLLTEAQASTMQTDWAKAGKEASTTGDFSGLHDLLADAAKMVVQNQRTAVEKARKDAEASAKKKMEKAGVHDLSTGGGSGTGGGRITSWSAAQKIKRVSDFSDTDYEKLIAGG